VTLDAIRLLVTDVDGCLTDGTVSVDADGREVCRYSKRDGVLLPAMREAGIEVVALTHERASAGHAARLRKLGIDLVDLPWIDMTTPQPKLAVLTAWAEKRGVPLSAVAYLGDDLPDLPCLEAVGAAFVPQHSPAHAALQSSNGNERRRMTPASWVRLPHRVVGSAGDGCLRDVCEILLRARGYDVDRWPVRLA